MSDNRKVRRLATRARRNAKKLEDGQTPEPIKWEDMDAALTAGIVKGVPAGTDLEEFIWQTKPESRKEIEARNAGRSFKPAEWAKNLGKDGA